ncbi:unnamed protein product, partial [Didymodactylos carnosus]
KYPNLTNFFGTQFWILEEYLSQIRTLDEKHPGYHLLQYLGIPNLIHHAVQMYSQDLDAEERLENLGKIIADEQAELQPRQMSNTAVTNKNIVVVETSN